MARPTPPDRPSTGTDEAGVGLGAKNPRLKRIRRLTSKRKVRSTERAFVVEGPALVAEALVEARRHTDADVSDDVAAILAAVRSGGDRALIDYTRRFDRLTLTSATLRVEPEEIAAAVAACDDEILSALHFAAERIEEFHRRQLPQDVRYRDDAGVTLGFRWTPLAAVGPDDPDARILWRVSVNGHSPLFAADELYRGAARLEKSAA